MHDLASASKWKNEVLAFPYKGKYSIIAKYRKNISYKTGGSNFFYW